MLFVDTSLLSAAGAVIFRVGGGLESITIDDVARIVELYNGESKERLLALAYIDAIKARAASDGNTGKFAEIAAALDAALTPREKDITPLLESLHLPGMGDEG